MDAFKARQRLKELYPELSESELSAAHLTLEQYFAVAWEIYEETVLSKGAVDVFRKTF